MTAERGPLHMNATSTLPLREEVFETLRNAILLGHLKPGERLMEIHLATELGVSRTPVREAIQMLVKEGLAEISPRRGARVAGMNLEDLRDVLEIREALEDLAVTCACEKMTEAQFAKMKKTMEDFAAATRTGDGRDIAEADERFHDAIYQASGNARLAAMIASLREQMYRYRYEYIKNTENHAQLVKEHSAILDGLRRKDKEAVRRIMLAHLENQMAAVQKQIEEQANEQKANEQ